MAATLFAPLRSHERVLPGLAAVLLVAPDLTATLIGLALATPPMLRQRPWLRAAA